MCELYVLWVGADWGRVVFGFLVIVNINGNRMIFDSPPFYFIKNK